MKTKTNLATLQQKAAAFDRIGNEYPVDPNFLWVTMDCQTLTLKAMATSHLFNCIKMLWNHWTPEQCRIQPYTQYRGIERYPKADRAWVVQNLYNELMNRDNRTPGMDEALERMRSMMQQTKLLLK